VSPVAVAAARWLDETRRWTELHLERELDALAADVPADLLAALRYSLLGGGKRIRPALVRLACAQHGGGDAAALPAALAIECVHTYSLVHDDLPCMDDDDLRRGRPTCHRVYGEALAVLAGDALLTWAFELLARAPHAAREQARVLARAAGAAGMVGGQVLDLGTAGRTPSPREVEAIHRGKTAALFGAATELGALAAGAEDAACVRARAFGVALGRCFQAIDDVLDVTAEAGVLGKTPGKDARQARPTLVAALGLAGARAEAERLAGEARSAARALGPEAGELPLALVDLLLAREA
jgi:geranylgeranyl pyrophosphate synthase